MSRRELVERIEALERQHRRVRSLAVVLGLALLVVAGVGWHGGSGALRSPDDAEVLRARGLVLVDADGRETVRMGPEEGGLRVSMIRAGADETRDGRPPGVDSVKRERAASVRGSLLLRPAPGLLLIGNGGRRVARLGDVEAAPLR